MSTKKQKKPPKVEKESIELEVKATASVDIPPASTPGKRQRNFRERLEAQAAYLSNVDGCAVSDIQKMDQFKQIPYATLIIWAKEDGWVEKRKASYAALQDRLTRQVSSRLTDRLYLEVQGLMKIRDQGYRFLEKMEDIPQRWDAVVAAIMKVEARLESLESVARTGAIDDQGRAQEVTQQAANPMTKIPYDSATLQEISKLFTTRKREAMRAKIAAQNPQLEPPTDEVTAKGPEPGPKPVQELPAQTGEMPVPEIQVPPKKGNE